MLKQLFIKVALLLGLLSPVQQEVVLPIPPMESPLISDLNANNSPEIATSTELGGESGESGESEDNCSCVRFARDITGYTIPRVESAKDLVVTRLEPKPNYWAIFKAGGIYGPHGHVAVVTSVATSTFSVVEFNLKPCKKTWRTIQKDDTSIKGFFGIN